MKIDIHNKINFIFSLYSFNVLSIKLRPRLFSKKLAFIFAVFMIESSIPTALATLIPNEAGQSPGFNLYKNTT